MKGAHSLMPQRFMAMIYRIWVMRHVDVPEEIGQALAKAWSGQPARGGKPAPKYIPVVATVNARSTRTTLVPAGGGRYRLQLNTELRKAARADAGDWIGLELRLDWKPRTASVPAELQAMLRAHPTARKAFEKMSPGHRRQFLTWLQGAKGPQARERRLEKAIDHLLERALLHPPTRRGRSPSP
jgi:hypothetical protein